MFTQTPANMRCVARTCSIGVLAGGLGVGRTRMMTLTELDTRLLELQRTVTDEDARLIAALLQITAAWRTNPEPPVSLMNSLTKAHGNVWFSADEASSSVYDLLVQFRSTVESLGGMIVHKRPVRFGLCVR